MKVYGLNMSTCTRKVLMTLLEKDLSYEFIIVDILKGEQKQPEHMVRQPFGVIPALDDDGFSLYESRAIIRYLDEKYQKIRLRPTDPQAFGLMEQWISIEQSYLSHTAVELLRHTAWAPMTKIVPDKTIIQNTSEKLKKVFGIANKTLSAQPYFAGKMYSLADICWMPYMGYLSKGETASLITEQPALHEWWKRVSERPAWAKLHA